MSMATARVATTIDDAYCPFSGMVVATLAVAMLPHLSYR